jgi:hypothetical protein
MMSEISEMKFPKDANELYEACFGTPPPYDLTKPPPKSLAPKTVEVGHGVIKIVPPKEPGEAERYARLCDHSRNLLRALREERERDMQAEVARQQLLDKAWETSRQTQANLDELYARTCHIGPFEQLWS